LSKKSPSIILTDKQSTILFKIASQKKTERRIYQRARIILGSATCQYDSEISKGVGLDRAQIRHWRQKWNANQDKLNALEGEYNTLKYRQGIISLLSDEARPGCPPTFTSEQVVSIIKISCESPESHGCAISHWSSSSLRDAVIKQGVVTTISKTQIGRFLK